MELKNSKCISTERDKRILFFLFKESKEIFKKMIKNKELKN